SGARSSHSFPTRRSSDLERKYLFTGSGSRLRRRRVFRRASPMEERPGVARPAVIKGTRSTHLAGWQFHHLENVSLRLAIVFGRRSEEHTSELQSRENLVC